MFKKKDTILIAGFILIAVCLTYIGSCSVEQMREEQSRPILLSSRWGRREKASEHAQHMTCHKKCNHLERGHFEIDDNILNTS